MFIQKYSNANTWHLRMYNIEEQYLFWFSLQSSSCVSKDIVSTPSQDVWIHYFNWHHFKTACCTSPVATGKNCAQVLNCILSVGRSAVLLPWFVYSEVHRVNSWALGHRLSVARWWRPREPSDCATWTLSNDARCSRSHVVYRYLDRHTGPQSREYQGTGDKKPCVQMLI